MYVPAHMQLHYEKTKHDKTRELPRRIPDKTMKYGSVHAQILTLNPAINRMSLHTKSTDQTIFWWHFVGVFYEKEKKNPVHGF